MLQRCFRLAFLPACIRKTGPMIAQMLMARNLAMNWPALDGVAMKTLVHGKCTPFLNYILNKDRSLRLKTNKSAL